MKDIKALLKEAREAIKTKDFNICIKLCKSILREDKENYIALVFLGLSLQEIGPSDQSKNAFKKAIELNPTNPLAWNGLVNFLEKNSDLGCELIQAYHTLLKLETNETKLLDYCLKLSKLADNNNLYEIVSSIYDLHKSGKCSENLNNILLSEHLLNLLMEKKEISQNLLKIYEEIYDSVADITPDIYNKYLTILYRQNQYDNVLKYAKKMYITFQNDTISLNWLCKLFNEFYVETNNFLMSIEEMQIFTKQLSLLEKNSAMAQFTESIFLLNEQKIFEATKKLRQVVNLRAGLLYAWILLCKCLLKLYLFKEAISAVSQARKLYNFNQNSSNKLKKKLDLIEIEALSRSENKTDLRRVLDLFNDEQDCLEHLIRAHIRLGNVCEAEKLLGCNYQLLKGQLLRKQNQLKEALEVLENLQMETVEFYLELGDLYWELEFDLCLMQYLKAAKLEPFNYLCFLKLGLYYEKVDDLDKARRCLEKAFKLNEKNSQVAMELSKIYRKLKKWDVNLVLLKTLANEKITKNNSWVWLQLGLNFLEQENYIDAIDNLRLVTRIDENVLCWESLADAYLAKGSYTSALKCYENTIKLGGSSLYPNLQIANIKKILGDFLKARLDFDAILNENKDYVPALKGLSETYLCQANECIREQRLATARDFAQLAAEKLIDALEQRSDFSCLWKLLGDTCFLVAKLPEKYCCLLIKACVIEGQNVKKNRILEMDDLYNFAAKCYCKAINLTKDNMLIWHDLACLYFSHAQKTEDKKMIENYLKKAQVAVSYCLSINPTSQSWNLLGNIAVYQDPPNYGLCQHCFIKAVTNDNNCAISWSNLGTLYLILGYFKLANDAFSQAQRADPNYVNSWIGQALLAEQLQPKDAMDLFRHSTQLGMHQQSALGYGYWVCRTIIEAKPGDVIYAIHNMYAINIACDVLTWFTERNPGNSSAWNMLGILQERLNLNLSALKSFQNAVNLSPLKTRDLALINCGRLLVKVGRNQEAIEMYSKVEAATLDSGSGLALALFKEGLYEESYEAYESILHWLSTHDTQLQSDLLVALAAIAYMFQGVEAAKMLLFQSVELDKPSMWAFYASLSLGLLHSDRNLIASTLQKMGKYKYCKECRFHYATLLAYTRLWENKDAVVDVVKFVHCYPDDGKIWLVLASILVRLKINGVMGAKCAQVAMKLGQANMDVTKVLCLVSLAWFLGNDRKQALLMAQKAVHYYPDMVHGWALLVFILRGENRYIYYIKKICEFLLRFDSLKKWISEFRNLK